MTFKRKNLGGAVVSALIVLLAGCAAQPFHVPMPEHVQYDASRGRELWQRSCGFMLGGAIPILMSDRYQRGYDALVKQANGDYVTDIKVQEALRYAFVGWRYCLNFEATAYPRISPEPRTS